MENNKSILANKLESRQTLTGMFRENGSKALSFLLLALSINAINGFNGQRERLRYGNRYGNMD
jgi:hypothetical protein